MAEDKQDSGNWRETGRVHIRLKPEQKAQFIEISEQCGQCGPTNIINMLLQNRRDLQAIQG
jgi:hypothetical protein